MSTKASSLNASANNSPTSPTINTSTTTAATAPPTVVKIKKELPSDEIKEFAESTMNELLGWYGFDGVDRLDLSSKTSKFLQSAAIINSQQQQHQQHHLEKRRSRSSRTASLLHMHQQQQQQQQQNEHLRTLNNNHINNNNNNNNNNNGSHSSNILNNNRKISSSLNCNSNNNYRGNDSTTSDHDTRSSRDDDSKSPNSASKTHSTTTANIADEKLDYQNCCWCRRPVPENAPEFLTTSDGPRYCSESCFTQSRRASFKKAKTCDWCKHIRHAVSYVDFQDGASQLQFCSDKCLNQYKMQIFCKETQAHLDMNPHLKEQGLEAANNGANLITPDLWLRNCRSRSASPASTVSISPGPTGGGGGGNGNIAARSNLSAAPPSPPPRIIINNNIQQQQPQHSNSNTSHKPLISVTPASKLMSKSPSIIPPARQSPKHNRKKRPVRSCVTSDMINNRGNDIKTNSAAMSSGSIKPKPLMPSLNESSRSNMNQTNSQSLTQFATSCVQDLQMNVPPLSPMMDTPSSQPNTPHSLPPTPNRGGPTSIPPAFFATPPLTAGSQPTQPPNIAPPGFPQRPPFLHNPPGGFLPRFMGNFPGMPPQAPTAGFMPPDMTAWSTFMGTPPPVTVMVPYPVIIPLPIPIPVPLPVVDFYKAYLTPEERKTFEEQQKLKTENSSPGKTSNHDRSPPAATAASPADTEQPLDFTKSRETEQETNGKNTTADKQSELPSSKLNEEFSPNAKAEECLPIANSSPSEDSQSTSAKSLHCIMATEKPQQENDGRRSSGNKMKSDFVATSELNEDSNELAGEGGAGGETNQKLPKLKITRLQTKRTLIQTKEQECSRPLRKRKRIIDCDFQKFSSSTTTITKETNELDDELQQQQQTTENELNKGQINNNKK